MAMLRRTLREQIFKLLFRVEFLPGDQMKKQEEMFFDSGDQTYSEEDRKEISDKFEKILQELPEIDRMIAEKTEGWGIDRPLQLTTLAPWKDLPLTDEGRAFSGTATYETVLRLSRRRRGRRGCAAGRPHRFRRHGRRPAYRSHTAAGSCGQRRPTVAAPEAGARHRRPHFPFATAGMAKQAPQA